MTTTAFLTDSTLCIGCKACEVACKEWNGVSADGFEWTGMSYDNTAALGHSSWRHVSFLENGSVPGHGGNSPETLSWSFLSDVCKHCETPAASKPAPLAQLFVRSLAVSTFNQTSAMVAPIAFLPVRSASSSATPTMVVPSNVRSAMTASLKGSSLPARQLAPPNR